MFRRRTSEFCATMPKKTPEEEELLHAERCQYLQTSEDHIPLSMELSVKEKAIMDVCLYRDRDWYGYSKRNNVPEHLKDWAEVGRIQDRRRRRLKRAGECASTVSDLGFRLH